MLRIEARIARGLWSVKILITLYKLHLQLESKYPWSSERIRKERWHSNEWFPLCCSNLVVLGYTSDASGAYAELRDIKNGSLIRIFPLRFGELLSFSSQLGDPEIVFRSQTLEGLPTLSTYDTSAAKPVMKVFKHLICHLLLYFWKKTILVIETCVFTSHWSSCHH